MPPKNLRRVTTYVPPEIAKALEEWAEKDERSVSWLAGKLIEKGVQEHQSQEQQQASAPEVKEWIHWRKAKMWVNVKEKNLMGGKRKLELNY